MKLLNERFLFILLAAAGFVLASISVWQEQTAHRHLILQETEEKLAITAHAVVDQLHGKTFKELLQNANADQYPSGYQLEYLHRILQPHAETLSTNGIGVAFYDMERNSIVAFGPQGNLKQNFPQPLPDSHPSRKLLENKQPSFEKRESAWRGTIYSYFFPLMQDGKVYAVIGASLPVDIIQSKLDEANATAYTLIGVCFLIWCLLLVALYYIRKNVYNRFQFTPWTEMILQTKFEPYNFFYGSKKVPLLLQDFAESTYNYQQMAKKIMDHSASYIMIMNTQNRYLYINSKVQELLGYTLEELNELPLKERLLMFDPLPGHQRVTTLLYAADDDELTSEYVATTKGHDKIPVQIRAFPISLRGRIEGIVMSLHDLRELHQFQRLQTQTTLLLESMNEGILMLDEDGSIAYMNRAFEEILSTQRSEWVGRTVFEAHMDSELHDSFRLVLSGRSAREHAKPGEFLNRPMEHLSLDIVPFEDQANKIKGALLIGRDETTEWQWTELSKRTDLVESLSKMAASMAHEVRNPMTSIKGFLQLLSQNQPEPGKLEMYVKVMMEELERANGIITEYLSLSRSNLVSLSKVSILRLLDDIRILMESEAVIRGVNLHFYLSNAVIECDSTKIKQVMINLVRNALEATSRGGAVTVSSLIDEENQYVQVQVTDTGSGIASEALPHIFTPFYTTKKGGTGLGLPVCKQIVEEHGGSIKATSKEETGSCFTVTLPLPQTKESFERETVAQ